MERVYSEDIDLPVEFFLGAEVENTPMLGQSTLFVVGIHDSDRILELAIEHNVKHVYFGANQCFETYNGGDDQEWIDMISPVLVAGYWATLDFDLEYWNRVQRFPFANHGRFIPMISVKIPHIESVNSNTTIKIDDKGFAKTNPGVWCYNLKNITDINKSSFTDWSKYTQDKVIKTQL